MQKSPSPFWSSFHCSRTQIKVKTNVSFNLAPNKLLSGCNINCLFNNGMERDALVAIITIVSLLALHIKKSPSPFGHHFTATEPKAQTNNASLNSTCKKDFA